MRHPASALALVVLGFAAPALVSIGCGGSEWKPVAGPTVTPAMPAFEPREAPARKRRDHDGPTISQAAMSAAIAPPAASASASASASSSAKPPKAPKAPPPPPKKKLGPAARGPAFLTHSIVS